MYTCTYVAVCCWFFVISSLLCNDFIIHAFAPQIYIMLGEIQEEEDRDQLRLSMLEKAVASIKSAVKKSSKSTNAVNLYCSIQCEL